MRLQKNSKIFTRTLKNNIIKKCFKNQYGVNFLQMGWQIIKSLDSNRNKDLHTVDARQNFTEIFPNNSNSPITRTVFRFPVEFELPDSTVHTYKAKFTQKCINY